MSETHPLKPFLPKSARILMLGTFPPKREKWCMDFYYPNPLNDMWRIFGLVFLGRTDFFLDAGTKKFSQAKIEKFLKEKGIALFDTAIRVERLRDNASDNFLEILERTDIAAMLKLLPDCKAIACTGAKAALTASETMQCEVPAQGKSVEISFGGKFLKFYRMPSSSRAYPMKIDKKAEAYARMFEEIGLL